MNEKVSDMRVWKAVILAGIVGVNGFCRNHLRITLWSEFTQNNCSRWSSRSESCTPSGLCDSDGRD